MTRAVKVATVAVVGTVAMGAAALVAFVALVWWKNRPPSVPPDFRAPSSLPESSTSAPDGSLFYDSDRSGTFEVYAASAPGAPPVRLSDDPEWDSWWPRLSPDRRHVLFYRTPAGVHDTDFSATHLWVMGADGSNPVELRPPGLDGWAQQGHADWSPSGSALVMFGGNRTNPQIYVTDVTGQRPRRMTERGGVSIDPSFSPDGQTIAFVGCPGSVCFPSDYEIYTIPADGEGAATRITHDGMRDQDPYFSPDGTRLAWLTQTSTAGRHAGGSWNIRLAAADGSGTRNVTDDDQVNSKPEWSRDSRTIYFHRLEIGRLDGFSIFAVDPAGGDMREVTAGQPGVNEFPST